MPNSIFIVTRLGNGWGTPRFFHSGFLAAWSPDGKTIGVVTENTIILAPVNGGPEVSIPRNGMFGEQVGGFAWSPDSRIIYHDEIAADGTNYVWAAPATGGTQKVLLHMTDPLRQAYRQWIAVDPSHVYFTIGTRGERRLGDGAESQIELRKEQLNAER